MQSSRNSSKPWRYSNDDSSIDTLMANLVDVVETSGKVVSSICLGEKNGQRLAFTPSNHRKHFFVISFFIVLPSLLYREMIILEAEYGHHLSMGRAYLRSRKIDISWTVCTSLRFRGPCWTRTTPTTPATPTLPPTVLGLRSYACGSSIFMSSSRPCAKH